VLASVLSQDKVCMASFTSVSEITGEPAMHNAVNLQGFLPLGKSNRTDLQVFYQPPDAAGGDAATGRLNAYMGLDKSGSV
jgi:hypothetical protein